MYFAVKNGWLLLQQACCKAAADSPRFRQVCCKLAVTRPLITQITIN